MSVGGTAAYAGVAGLPPLVARAVGVAERLGFELSCLPEQGRLLAVLATGRRGGVIGETGTGCGVGLAWMCSAVDRSTRLVSVERDPERAAAAADLFRAEPNVTVLTGDWPDLGAHGPFDLLVLDGGGGGKDGTSPADPMRFLTSAGCLVIDDFTPSAAWPPLHDGAVDTARLHWLEHPSLLATEIRTSATASTLVAVRR